MYKIYLFEYKTTVNHGKLYAVKAIMERLNLGLKEAKDWVEALPASLDNQTKEDFSFYQEHFRCEIKDSENNHNIQESDEATATALIWLSAQPDFIKDNVKLISDWERRNHFVGCS